MHAALLAESGRDLPRGGGQCIDRDRIAAIKQQLNGGDDFALSRIELGDGHSGSIRLQAGLSYLLIQLAWGNRARRGAPQK